MAEIPELVMVERARLGSVQTCPEHIAQLRGVHKKNCTLVWPQFFVPSTHDCWLTCTVSVNHQ